MSTTKERTAICLTPDCGRDARIRGLCLACYSAARRAVDDGATTWEALEADGRILPDGRLGRFRRSLDSGSTDE